MATGGRACWAGLVAAVAVAAASQAGCSWAFMTRPPQTPVAAELPLTCTESRAAPVLDTAGAAFMATLGIAGAAAVADFGQAFAGSPCVGACIAGMAVVLVPTLAAATVYGFSAAHGYSGAGRCEDLRSWQGACIAGDSAACERLRGTRPAPASTAPGTKTGDADEAWVGDAAAAMAARLATLPSSPAVPTP